MILCDIGNSSAKFYENGKLKIMPVSEFENFSPKERIFFINVNQNLKQKLANEPLFFDLFPYFELKTNYKGLGIDRIAGCLAVENGVIMDAGSAITIDLMQNGKHLGGFIMPGIWAYLQSFKAISPVLDIDLNTALSLEKLPQNTKDAVSFGILKSVILIVENFAKNEKIFITGGDGKFFSKFFKNAVYDRDLIFRAMLKVIEKKGLK